MNPSKSISKAMAAVLLVGGFLASTAQADPLVTYTWTTTSEGFGPHVDKPSSASFQVPLSDVLAGTIPFFDITNIQLTYPGLTFDSTATSSIGFDFAAFDNPATGALIFKDDQQGLAVIAFAGTDINSATTFLSITVDNPVSGAVADSYNALNNGSAYAGFPTAGFWSASFPTISVPEPATLGLLSLGLVGVGLSRRRLAR